MVGGKIMEEEKIYVCECSDCLCQFETTEEEPSCPKCGSGDIIVGEGEDEDEDTL